MECQTPIYTLSDIFQLMRIVVGADTGHAALREMTRLIRAAGAGAGAGAGAEGGEEAAGLARGAVFYTAMALWGPRRVHTLHVSLLAVLPAFLKVTISLNIIDYSLTLCLYENNNSNTF